MHKKIVSLFALLTALAMVLAPLANTPAATAQSPSPQHMPTEVSGDVQALREGMSVDEFLAQNKGPIPQALWPAVDTPITIVIELEQPSLITSMIEQGKTPSSMGTQQRAYAEQLLAQQEPLVAAVKSAGGTILGRYTRTYNGVLAMVPGKQIDALRKEAGVKAIYRAPRYTYDLTASVPLIGAPDVWSATPTGYDGTGVRVAIIDTGIDYTHAAFGGSGLAADYASNDPDVIETGTFPTAKVVGGYDFAGTAYDADTNPVPVPDDDPLDEAGHGTHVSSITAGMEVTDPDTHDVLVGAGVAPGASLYALKVFGAEGSTDLVLSALEWAMDPNGDYDLSDRVDVINMSLGSSWGAASDDDPEQVIVNNISAMGTFVAISAGNEGDSSYVAGAPSVADSAISVAASSTGYLTAPTVKYGADLQAPYTPGNPFTSAITATLADVDAYDGDNIGELCATSDVTTTGALTGKIALIQRGVCSFEDKINNADALGALGVIIYNNSRPDDDFISMLTNTATLPAGHTVHAYGLALKSQNGNTVTVGPDDAVASVPYGNPDEVGSFSSRGPRGYDSKLKPEISAPGVAIFAAAMGSGTEGVSYNGTSMAAPHVAGVAALIHEAHPDWDSETMKAAMMSTAVDMDSGDANAYQIVPRTGAGRVDAYKSVFTQTIASGDANLVSLSWGVLTVGADTTTYPVPETKSIRVTNLSGTAKTYNVGSFFSNSATMLGASFDLPASVDVPAGETRSVSVALNLDPTQLPIDFGEMEEYYGFITLTDTSTSVVTRVPFYFVPRPYSTLEEEANPDTELHIQHHPTVADFDAMIDFTQSGPVSSDLWAWPLLVSDPNEANVADSGDLRAAGIDFLFTNGTYGDILGVGIANWGSMHTLQPYFGETDLWFDVNEDGIWDIVLFNYNYGELTGGDADNDWILVEVDYTGSQPVTYLGSPYNIFADFNSGIQEWYIPAEWVYLGETASRFTYQFLSYDASGTQDVTPEGTFNYMKSPLSWDFTNYTPGSSTTLGVDIYDSGGYIISKPEGILVFDYNGQPGWGQSYLVPLTVVDLPMQFLPSIHK
jgi:minor extracellular serine protease Vpr